MVICWPRFNFILPLLAAALVLAGCETTGFKKDLQATFRVHLEANPRYHPNCEPVAIYRAEPILVNVDKDAFLNEAFIERVEVVNSAGGFALMVKFDARGMLILEQITSQNPGKHLAISAAFGKKLSEARWLSAPLITRRINNGFLVFTPDCSREEADLIAAGLNNVSDKVERKKRK